MGLLDSLFQSDTYGGQGGGLLDFLRNNAMNQQFGSGLQSDQAQYGQPPMQAMAQAAPMQSAPPMAAQAMQAPPSAGPMPAAPQAPPMQAAPQGLPPALGGVGSILGRLGNPDGLIAKLTGNDTRSMAQQNLKAQYDALVPMLGQQKAMLAILNPEAGKTLIAQALEKKQYGFQKLDDGTVLRTDPMTGRAEPAYQGAGGKQTDDIREYEYAKKEDPSLTFEKFMARKKAVSGEYGMQPIWGTGPDGKPAVLQLGKSGDAKQSVLPQGFSLSRDPIKVEGPTGTTILDPQTRQQVAFIPKDVAGAAKSHEIGQAEGQAAVNLPTTIATAETALKTIKQLEEHPGKKSWGAFGVGAMLPDMPGTDTRGFAALVDQVKGQNFMTAFQSLKGAGAITEQEGAKAEKAQARLDRAQSEKDFDVALKDLKEVVVAGMERARQKAGIKNNQAMPPPAPATPGLPSGWSVKVN